MSMRFTQLQCKEVICLRDGRRLGYVTDVQLEVPEGNVIAIVVPGHCRMFGLGSRAEDYLIPWSCIRRIGPDTVLVDIKPEDCRVPRTKAKPGWHF
ncbi:MAG: YlmC/YmxH family sporulation protein [Oscillospiraceae bacterium]|nr:YlmC/YmxH family sporulation protein [Oscillospiraceae bacterium]